MKPSSNFMTGKTSRSLKAAFRVVKEELASEVAHLDGGMVAWCGRPPSPNLCYHMAPATAAAAVTPVPMLVSEAQCVRCPSSVNCAIVKAADSLV